MPRALVPVFVLYSAIAVFAAYGARVVATKAERTAAPASDTVVIERLPHPLAEPADSAPATRTAVARRAGSAAARSVPDVGVTRGAEGLPGGSER